MSGRRQTADGGLIDRNQHIWFCVCAGALMPDMWGDNGHDYKKKGNWEERGKNTDTRNSDKQLRTEHSVNHSLSLRAGL